MLKIGTRMLTDVAPVHVGFDEGLAHEWGSPARPEHGGNGFSDWVLPVLLGDPECGPVVSLVGMAPSDERALFPAHRHASDNWRISVKGEFQMGNVYYPPGHFRLQRGWRNYPGDSYSTGPDGGWQMLMFADRRGIRLRPAQPEEALHVDPDEATRSRLQWMQQAYGVDNDMFGDVTSEESAIVSTLPERERGWHIDSSFDRAADWVDTGDGTKYAAILLGQRERGPLLVLSRTEPGATASPACSVGTELLRLVIAGGSTIGGTTHASGDGRIDHAGQPVPPVVAGPDGLDEVLLFGDRRGVAPSATDAGWTRSIGRVVDELAAVLAEQQPAPAVSA